MLGRDCGCPNRVTAADNGIFDKDLLLTEKQANFLLNELGKAGEGADVPPPGNGAKKFKSMSFLHCNCHPASVNIVLETSENHGLVWAVSIETQGKRSLRYFDDAYRQPRNPYSWLYTMFDKRARNPYSWMNE
ncbi:unnamed protein product [Haemonchus placei]|uniref:LAGLIDADG_2 domain-containing protein n=1 Tax=Haemonchus placei TaxID=6290 RepID=A0A0N4WLT9_HAEPC|nr:unnamed protein product [Haemonchus placei]